MQMQLMPRFLPQQPPVPLPRPAAPAAVSQPVRPRVVARGVAPETPPRVTLASPEQLGIRPPTPDAAIQARLARLGAARLQSDRLPLGVYRVSLLVPAGSNQTHTIDAVAETEAAAVQLALSRAEACVGRR